MFKPKRWSGENDRYFGPFTFCASDYKKFELMLSSGSDEYPGCYLRLSVWKYTLILSLPQIVPPYREKHIATSWDAATIQRMGGNFYYQVFEREYGISYWDGYLSLHLGRQTHDSTTTQSWSCFLPWTQWRHVRTSHYNLDGNHFYTEPQGNKYLSMDYQSINTRIEECPSVAFEFKDFDGEQLFARTRITEMEWLFGTGRFKWLSFFRKPKVSRSLDIRFSGETGKRKGSWKGGTIGHSITMNKGELHEDAFIRYCSEHSMTFMGKVEPNPENKGL